MSVETLLPYLPYVAYGLVALLGVLALAAHNRLQGIAKDTVAAVYRASIHAASALEAEGITWLRSEGGVAYRKHLASAAYDLLPTHIGSVPVGMVKLVISREQWVALVESAFTGVVELAEKIELPDVLPTA